jgi:hypothetical protein
MIIGTDFFKKSRDGCIENPFFVSIFVEDIVFFIFHTNSIQKREKIFIGYSRFEYLNGHEAI